MTSTNEKLTNGCIEYKNGFFIVKNPASGGNKASISPHPLLSFSVNGNNVEDTVFVESTDSIKVKTLDESPIRKIEIEVEPDLLRAYGCISYRDEKTFILLDSAPMQNFVPELIVEKSSHTEPFSQNDIINELSKKKILFGIIPDAIQQMLQNPGEKILLAEGYTPTDGKDGHISYPFKTESADEKQDYLDFWNKDRIHSTEKGSVLAIRTPAIKGKDGKNVHGKAIKPRLLKDPFLKAGKGVQISDDGLTAISSIDGEIIVNEPFVSVEPLHNEYGDVDLSTGHINFIGNVIVHGNVCEGMKINAGGDVTIHGFVSKATIVAGGTIKIKSRIFDSKITSGQKLQFLFDLHSNMMELYNFMTNINKMLVQIKQKLANDTVFDNQFGPILNKLTYENLPETFKALSNTKSIIENHRKDICPELSENLIHLLQKYSRENIPLVKSFREFTNDLRLWEKSGEDLKGLLTACENIEIYEAQKSTLNTTGDFIVHGRGCVNCRIKALGSIFINKAPGVFRGGQIKFSGEAQILEIGSSGGAITRIETDKNSKIFFSKAYFNTFFKFNTVEKKLEETQNRGMVYMNKDQLISILKL